MALSPQWLDELRARVTLSSVVMRTTKLQRAGSEWKACCPFHNEKSPSFTVSDSKGFYHCFGCGAHGDVIRWMTDQRGRHEPSCSLASAARKHAAVIAVPVTVAIANFTGSQPHQEPYTAVMAAGVIITIPLVIMVLLLQRRIVAGLTAGGVKGESRPPAPIAYCDTVAGVWFAT